MTRAHTSRHYSFLAYLFFFLLVAACTPPGNERLEAPGSREQQTDASELRELFAQNYIDPLSDYIKANSADTAKAEAVEKVKAERMKRCRRVAARYHRRAKNSVNLEKLTRGYGYSCPQVVAAFAALITVKTNENAVEKTRATQKDAVFDADTEKSVGLLMSKNIDESAPWYNVKKNFLFSCEDAFTAEIKKEVLRLCTVPAARGDARSQYYLGKTYAADESTRANLEEAFIWLNLSVRGGFQKATALRDKIGTLLNPAEHIKARHRAMEIAASY